MSASNQRAPAPTRAQTSRRPVACAAGLALAAAIAFLVLHTAPDAPTIITVGLPGLAGAAVVALAFTLRDEALPKVTQGALAAAGLVLSGALVGSQEARLRLFSLAMIFAVAGLTIWLARAGTRLPNASLSVAALYLATLATLSAYAAYLVLASRDLMIADFMTYRGVAVMIARLLLSGDWALFAIAGVESIARDYSWLPALAPGLALATTAPFSRAVYTFALLALYAAPAAIALAFLARNLACRATRSLQPSPAGGRGGEIFSAGQRVRRRWGLDETRRKACPERSDDGRRFNRTFVAGLAAVIAAYPAGMAVAARGMPDVGGLILVVVAFNLADRLARVLALPKGHDSRVAGMALRVSVALALAMFAFRRWYAIAAAGIAAALALEIVQIVLSRGAVFRWKEAVGASALGALTLLALASPIIVDWLPNLSAHDYASAYAAYRKPTNIVIGQLADWVGFLPTLAALGAAGYLWTHSKDRRLLRLTLGGSGVAALLFLHVQTPYIHHLYLIAPALTAPVAAALMIAYAKASRAALAALAGLAALTLSPLAATLNPLGVAPIAGLPRAPRADLVELERMRDWVDARARPNAKVCGLGSSYTFSGQLIGELWQLHPETQTATRKPKTDVMMSDVDTVEGPPAAALKDCVFMIVGDPVQTHLDPDYQQTVIIPSREILTGEGIGAKFRRAGEVFHLENGVSAVVFERVEALDDSDIEALRERWLAARAKLGFDAANRR